MTPVPPSHLSRREACELAATLVGGDAGEIEAGLDRMDEARTAFADDLRAAGFYAVANDVRANRCKIVDALDHVRRTIPKRTERGQREAQDVLDQWDWR